MPERFGHWMQTSSGRRFWPMDPRSEEVDFIDIGHALGFMCRFGGHCATWYSVACHSVFVSAIVENEAPHLALHALMHDAHEAYLGDVIRPLKPWIWVQTARSAYQRELRELGVIQRRVQRAIHQRLGLPELTDADQRFIARADAVALATEARDLMGNPAWPGLPAPYESGIVTRTPRQAVDHFLQRFGRLAFGIDLG